MRTGDARSARGTDFKLNVRSDRRFAAIIGLATALILAVALLSFLAWGLVRPGGGSASDPSATPASGVTAEGLEASEGATSADLTPKATSGSGASGAGGAGGTGGSRAVPGAPAASGSLPTIADMPAGVLTHLADTTGTVPQTYLVTADVLGWQSGSAGIVLVRCVSGTLLGALDPSTGAEKAKPPVGTRDHSAELAGVPILATTSPRARAALRPGVHKVQIVLMPSGGGATFVLDRVVR